LVLPTLYARLFSVSPATRTPSPRHCSVAGALDVVGEKWSLLVIRELMLGNRRFSDIADKTGAPRDILTARLRRLEELGVIERRVYSEKPTRHMYVLTAAGRDLRPVMMAIKHWGDVHVMHEHLPPVLEHTCGAVFEPRTHCAACGAPVDPRELTRVDVTGA
jgi:DNA-binding HxlR family transcriptional regulator